MWKEIPDTICITLKNCKKFFQKIENEDYPEIIMECFSHIWFDIDEIHSDKMDFLNNRRDILYKFWEKNNNSL